MPESVETASTRWRLKYEAYELNGAAWKNSVLIVFSLLMYAARSAALRGYPESDIAVNVDLEGHCVLCCG
jgi:hypothetical protein